MGGKGSEVDQQVVNTNCRELILKFKRPSFHLPFWLSCLFVSFKILLPVPVLPHPRGPRGSLGCCTGRRLTSSVLCEGNSKRRKCAERHVGHRGRYTSAREAPFSTEVSGGFRVFLQRMKKKKNNWIYCGERPLGVCCLFECRAQCKGLTFRWRRRREQRLQKLLPGEVRVCL